MLMGTSTSHAVIVVGQLGCAPGVDWRIDKAKFLDIEEVELRLIYVGAVAGGDDNMLSALSIVCFVHRTSCVC